MSNTEKDDVHTTGHEWDGIKEYDNPLPKWWLWVFYATIIWGVGYTIAYPAWPMINKATPGLLGWSTRENVQQDIDAVAARNADITQQLASADLSTIAEDPNLNGFAINAGASVFRANCSQCHGSGAQGVQSGGFPNLLDDDWLWGGALDDIVYTVSHGIRNEQDPDARWSQMPAFGEILPEEEITAVVQHVRAISGQEHDEELAAAGAEVFELNCASCHMDDGTGDRFQGAPNLTDAIWLYGGDADTINETVTYARFGVMPAWNLESRPGSGLTEAEIKAVAVYVHQLGGGE